MEPWLRFNLARLGVLSLVLAAALQPFSAVLAQVTIPPQITTYYYTDQVGSPVAAADKNGNVLWRETYNPYGRRLVASSASSPNSNLWFSASLETQGTGLLYMGARHYDPLLGRFMGVDPVGFTEQDSGSFGLYTYAANNPYSFNDPNGDIANFVIGGLKAGVENAVIQYAEIRLGIRDEFSLADLATDTAIGTVTSGFSTLKNSTRLARIIEKTAAKSGNKRLFDLPPLQRGAEAEKLEALLPGGRGKLPFNYKGLDQLPGVQATTLDTGAKSYRTASSIVNKLRAKARSLNEAAGAGAAKELRVGIPDDIELTAEQLRGFDRAAVEFQEKFGVTLSVIKIN